MMSPRAALESDVFLFYAGMVAALLAAAGVVLAILRWGLHRDVGQAAKAYAGWLGVIPVFLAALFLGREATIALFTLVAVFAFKEFARGTGLYEDWGLTGVAYLGILAVGMLSLTPDPSLGGFGWYGMFMATPVYVVATFFMIPILRNRYRGQIQAVSLAAMGFIYIGWMFGHLAFLANSPHAYAYLLYLLLAVELNDVAAFMFGKSLGRHKLRSNISSDKTWEGALEALAVSMVLPWLLRSTLPHFGTLQLVLTGLIVGVAGQLGDLSMSVIKRDLNVKDLGALIPGHGGILDRIDSLIYSAPLFFHMVHYFYGVYGDYPAP
jgi:phosphatidate cytidylyltransferase